jgi:DNA-binding beta-propeller fold protein YncE
VKGFANGALVNVINTAADLEVAAIPTGGFEQSELAVDRLGRNLWVAQYTLARLGEVLRVDVDRRSATRFTGLQRIPVDPNPYTVGAGPKGIDVTPDGSTVVVSVIEDTTHAVPVAITVDALSNTVVGTPITVESLCATVSVQQR